MDSIAEYGNEYVMMVKGSEIRLEMETPDYLSQAAHSIRDCLEQLIKQLAPKEIVEQQPWFEITKGTPDGVARRYRIRYILYGPGEIKNGMQLDQIDREVDNAMVILNLAMQIDHDHNTKLTKQDVILAIDQARSVLLNLIKKYKSRRN